MIERLVMTGIRTGFRVGEKVWPQQAANQAVRLWMRVPKPPPPARRDRGVEPGEPLEIYVNGRPINALAWGEGPVVACAHGWSGWWQQFSVYIEPLTAAGFRVVTWDAPSHGDSAPGRFGTGRSGMPELAETISAVFAAVGPIHGLIAHSGAALAALQAMHTSPAPQRLAFISSSVAGSDQLSYFSDLLGWGPRTVQLAEELIERRYDVELADWELLNRLPAKRPPLLILHFEDDAQTPLSAARRLADQWPGAQLRTSPNLDHHRILWAEWTENQVLEFMTERLP